MKPQTKHETERKYLIVNPSPQALESEPDCRKEFIEQTYLTSPKGKGRRVRKTESGGTVRYVYNEKRPLSGITRLETEYDVTEAEYKALLLEAVPGLSTIYKTRYTVPRQGLHYEIDVYSFSKNRAILEVELDHESQQVPVPPFLTVLKEVTHDKAFSNKSIAKTVPSELLK